MAAHSSILAWRIPGTGEPVGVPSMGSHTTHMTAAATAVPGMIRVLKGSKNCNSQVVKALDLRSSGFISSWVRTPLLVQQVLLYDFPGGSDGKPSAYNAGDQGSIPGSGISPGEGNGNPLQYSFLDNPMDSGTWKATVHGAANSRTRLSNFTSHKQLLWV